MPVRFNVQQARSTVHDSDIIFAVIRQRFCNALDSVAHDRGEEEILNGVILDAGAHLTKGERAALLALYDAGDL